MNKFIKRILGAATAVAVAVGSMGAVPGSVLPSLCFMASADSSLNSHDFGYSLPAGTYYLESDLTIHTKLRLNDAVTIDLKGHTFTIDTPKIYGSSNDHAINLNSGDSLTIRDTVGGGSLVTKVASNKCGIFINYEASSVTINGAVFKCEGGSIYGGGSESGATISVINGGVLDAPEISGYSSGNITVTNSTLKNCTVEGAVFSGATIDNCTVSSSTITGGTVTGSTVKANSTIDDTADIKSSTVQNSTVGGEQVTNDTYDENGNTGFTVTFNLNGASGSIDSQNIANGAKATKPTAAPTREGYTFKGWYDNPDCTGTAFDFANTAITANTTLYAKWLQHITYIDENGEEQTVGDDEDYTPVTSSDVSVTWEAGTYVVADDVTVRKLTLTGDVDLIVCNDCTLYVENNSFYQGSNIEGGNCTLNVFAQKKTDEESIVGDISAVNCTVKALNLYGGGISISNNLTAQSFTQKCGFIGVSEVMSCPSISLDWSSSSDQFYAEAFEGTPNITFLKNFCYYVYEEGYFLAAADNIAGKTIVPAYKVTFTADDVDDFYGGAPRTTGKVTKPEPVTINGQVVVWYSDNECTKKFDFANTVITEDTTIYGKAEELTKIPAKTATCTAAGNKEYYKDSAGNLYVKDGEVYKETTLSAVTTGALGHSYKDGKCTRCGAADPNYSGGKTPSRPTYPTGGGSATTPPKTNEPKIEGGNGASGWSNIASEISKTPEGGSVTVDMAGTTTVPKSVLEAVKGKDVDLVLDMGEGIKWTINGKDVTDVSGSIDLGVTVGTSGIPVDVINSVTGERYNMVISLAHSGAFGFTATLTVNMRKQDAGLIANLFYYNPTTKALEFVSSGKIKDDGTVDLEFGHASDYTIVVDDHPLDDEDADIAEDDDDEYYDNVISDDSDDSADNDVQAAADGDDVNPHTGVPVTSLAVMVISGLTVVTTIKRKKK